MAASESNHVDELSRCKNHKIRSPGPLLRGPVRAGPPDDPSSGPYVLVFRDPKAWANAYRACESKIVEQCEAGARIACAVSASEKCKPPWWRAMIGQKVTDLKQREQCEEREMEGCLTAAKEKCGGFAKEKCLKPFREARIAGVNVKQVERLVCWGTLADLTDETVADEVGLCKRMARGARWAERAHSKSSFEVLTLTQVILKPMKCSMRTGLHTPLPSRDVTVVVVLTEAHSSAAARI
ncbi:hypothetical protein ACFX2B_007813 [Malus domestica]